MLIFVEHIFLSLPSRLVTFLGSLLLSAVGLGIDYFQLLLLIEIFVGLLQLVTVWVWVFCFGLSLNFFFPPSSLHIFMQFSSMSGTQILDLYFLLSSTDNIFPCVKEHFWYFRCMYIIWCSLSCIYNKDSWFRSLLLIKVWHGRISGFSKFFRCVVMVLQRHCQNLTWGRALICSINGVSAFHSVSVYCPRLYKYIHFHLFVLGVSGQRCHIKSQTQVISHTGLQLHFWEMQFPFRTPFTATLPMKYSATSAHWKGEVQQGNKAMYRLDLLLCLS